MIELDSKQITEFLCRSYTAVDGLWFVKVEEKYGFDTALDLDNEVWKVFPKIQARMLKSMGKMTSGVDALFECLTTKLTIEGFGFRTERIADGGFRIIMSRCPWHDAMVKSGREDMSGKVNSRICHTECSVWAAEFGAEVTFTVGTQICKGAERCILEFR